MRLIHTADWHLGRILHGVHLTEDQAHVLDQFVTLVQDSQVRGGYHSARRATRGTAAY